jgi:hypothetical protein
MRLLVSGCSFSAGADLEHVIGGETAEDIIFKRKTEGFLWPNLISDANGYELHNISVPGNSNDKITRSAIEWIEKNGATDTIAIIQFSSPYRHEFFSSQFSDYVNYCTNSNSVSLTLGSVKISSDDILYDCHTDNSSNNDKLQVSKMQQKSLLAISDMLKYVWNKENLQIKFLQNVLFLQNYLKDMGIPYLFTSMSIESHPVQMMKDLSPQRLDYTRILRNAVDLDKWTQSMTSVGLHNTFDDGHPSYKGNQLIANHIQEHLTRIISERQ